MAIKYAIDKWPIAFPSKTLAREGGAYIFNITAGTDSWNGAVVAKGAFQELDRYAEATAGTVNFKVLDKAPNGNWYIEVMEDIPAATALIVYQVPMIEEEYNSEFKSLKNFYIPKDTVMRAYQLKAGDIWELSAEAFTATPTKGASITTITGKKLTV